MHYWGVEASPEAIAEEIYSKSAKGTLGLDMVLYARKKGLDVVQSRGSIKSIKENIDLGYPVIVLVDYRILDKGSDTGRLGGGPRCRNREGCDRRRDQRGAERGGRR